MSARRVAAAGAVTVALVAAGIALFAVAPQVGSAQVGSYNWSGYADTAAPGTFTAVSATCTTESAFSKSDVYAPASV